MTAATEAARPIDTLSLSLLTGCWRAKLVRAGMRDEDEASPKDLLIQTGKGLECLFKEDDDFRQTCLTPPVALLADMFGCATPEGSHRIPC